jgi:hypothetical protein
LEVSIRRRKSSLAAGRVEDRIYTVRGRRIMLDRDLAEVYGVPTKRLNEQVKRNRDRFPEDFAFQLTLGELRNWMSQFATSNSAVKMGLRKPPYVFTEHGAVAAAFVLNSRVAVSASIQIVRAFNRLRQTALDQSDLTDALEKLVRKVAGHDEQFEQVFAALRTLAGPQMRRRKQIGFKPPGKP